MISPRLGIVNTFRKAQLHSSDPNIVAYSATTADVGRLTDSFQHLAGGAGLTWIDAFLATIGEAAERYGSSFYKLAQLRQARQRDLPADEVVDCSRYALFADQQYDKPGFPFVRFTPDLELYWDRATDLTDGRDRYVPAAFLYMPFRADAELITEQISTGFAIHSDPHLALLSAIFEVVERDSFMIAWMNLLPLPRIRITGELKQFTDAILPRHFELCLLDMTTDLGVPSVMGLMRGHHDFGEFIVACAASRNDIMAACRKTVIELSQSIPYFRNLLELDKDFTEFESVKTFAEHSLFYLHRADLRGVFDAWFDTPATVTIDRVPEQPPVAQVRNVVRKLRDAGYHALAKDKTTPDLKEAGFCLVRAVVPGLIHLNGTYGSYFLGGERLYAAPQRMGHTIANDYESLNHLPHPFP